MTIIRTFAFAGLAFAVSLAGASASTIETAHMPTVNVTAEPAPAFANMLSFGVFGRALQSEGSQYTIYMKAPHNGFDLNGNGVNPPIGPITD